MLTVREMGGSLPHVPIFPHILRLMTRKRFAYIAGAAGAALALRLAVRHTHRIDFVGRTVVITGGRGLALEMARFYAKEGARITLLARDADELQQAQIELERSGAEVFVRTCDIRNQDEIQAAVRDIVDLFGRIDVLVNDAGVIQVGPIENMNVGHFENAMAVHTWGPLYLMLAVIPHMKQGGEGRIVNISSIGGKVAVPHLMPYSTSKFALVGLSDGMRAELAKDGIRVSTICPGLMRTGSHLNAYFLGQHEKEFAWFAISDANPLLSTSAKDAARRIVEASRYGDPRVILTLPAKALHAVDALFPSVTSACTKLAARLLPKAEHGIGDTKRTGWESRSEWAPSILTRPADRAVQVNNESGGPTPPEEVSRK
jgi:NAD(P)-dependent dehydrogenase (short-subunit alcohol dehydrogenase family)